MSEKPLQWVTKLNLKKGLNLYDSFVNQLFVELGLGCGNCRDPHCCWPDLHQSERQNQAQSIVVLPPS
jgi:hypothetical protein